MHLSWSRMRALNAVIETGGFSSAARTLGVSQPAITQAVRDIEREAGVTLFDRRGREIAPTALCSELYRLTAEAVRCGIEAGRLLQRHRELGLGEFRVGLGNSMPGMALIRAFRERCPGVRISVELGSWSQIVEAVTERRVDIGVLPNVPDDGRFVRSTCLVQDVVAIVSERSALAAAEQTSCEELMRHPLIFRTARSSTQRVVDAGFRAAGLVPAPALVLDTRDGVYEAAANGLGVGFMWEYGSSRRDSVRKLRVLEFRQGHPEHVFHLTGQTNAFVELFKSLKL
ncbi:MAG: LysR family transcriptional regulator [Paracoccaceae bacterium]